MLLNDAPSEFATERARANGDWITSLCSVDLWRLIAMTMLPSWDIGESAAEMKRAYEIGHRAARRRKRTAGADVYVARGLVVSR